MFSLDPRRDSEWGMIQQFEVNSLALPRSSLLLRDVSQKGNSLAQVAQKYFGNVSPQRLTHILTSWDVHFIYLSVLVIGL